MTLPLEPAATAVVVGAGLAGVRTAMELRDQGFAGRLVLFGDEARAYDRPPLSKEALLDGDLPAGAELLTAATAAEHKVNFRPGVGVARLDRAARRVIATDGSETPYDVLVLATGGAARTLPHLPADNARVFLLRTVEDARALAGALQPGRRLLVMGGGWLGLEAATAALARGVKATLVDQADRLCARSVPAEVSTYLHTLHHAQGLNVRLGAPCRVERADDGRILLGGDSAHPFDLCLVAIGMTPNDGLARAAGLACDNGVLADPAGQTDDSAIFAVGDVAAWFDPALGRHHRLESWQSAKVQARRVAARLLGRTDAAAEAPWFWSEQGGRMIQAAGLADPASRLIGFEDGDRPLWRYGRGETVDLVVGVDRARDLRMAHRALSQQRRAVEEQPV
jgi:3-phenylpropionate/trans-cinnamate dioxygenase ferredoxin reductase subunit